MTEGGIEPDIVPAPKCCIGIVMVARQPGAQTGVEICVAACSIPAMETGSTITIWL